jgi:Sap-like sulfolipid-1-addressing protein
VLAEPRLGLAMLAGALAGLPGAAYLSALHNLVTGKSPTAAQVVAVIIFVLIEFLLIIVPFAFLELRPEATKAALRYAQHWLAGHARQLMAYRSDPGRLPGNQRSGAPDLTCPCARQWPQATPAAGSSVLNHLASQHMSPHGGGAAGCALTWLALPGSRRGGGRSTDPPCRVIRAPP